jgi:hypothetical protein
MNISDVTVPKIFADSVKPDVEIHEIIEREFVNLMFFKYQLSPLANHE